MCEEMLVDEINEEEGGFVIDEMFEFVVNFKKFEVLEVWLSRLVVIVLF